MLVSKTIYCSQTRISCTQQDDYTEKGTESRISFFPNSVYAYTCVCYYDVWAWGMCVDWLGAM